MKITNVTLTAMALLTPFLFAEKGHEGHDHDNHADATHDHVKNIAGPNGGKVFTSSEPHFEFFVTEERKIRLTFLDKDNKAAATPEGAAASAGRRGSIRRRRRALGSDKDRFRKGR